MHSIKMFYRRLFGRTFALAILAVLIRASMCDAQTSPTCGTPQSQTATRWMRWECVLDVEGPFQGRAGYANTRVKMTFTRAGWPTRFTYGFWDGGTGTGANKARFRFRFSFEATGTWNWATTCETPSTCGSTTPPLVMSGSVTSSAAIGVDPLYTTKGPLGLLSYQWWDPLSSAFRYWHTLFHTGTGGTFVWLGDSAWAGPMRASSSAWSTYIANRDTRNFTIVHVGPAPPWAGTTDLAGNPPFLVEAGCDLEPDPKIPHNCAYPNPVFWSSFDLKVKAANDVGLVAFMTGLMEPVDRYPTDANAELFARWMASRLAGDHVILSPGFDSEMVTRGGSVLQSVVGSAIKAVSPLRLVANHWSFTTTSTAMASLQSQSWLSFQMFQSGHMSGAVSTLTGRARDLALTMSGAQGTQFTSPRKAAVNGEAIYDQGGLPSAPFSAHRARHTAYLSWLGGSFGYTFGSAGIWDWGLCAAGGVNNPCGVNMTTDWSSPTEAVQNPASAQMQYLGERIRDAIAVSFADYFDAYEQDRIYGNAVANDLKRVFARTSDRGIAYLPYNTQIKLDVEGLTGDPALARFWNPRSGAYSVLPLNYSCNLTEVSCTFTNPFYSAGNPSSSDALLEVPVRTLASGMWAPPDPVAIQVFAGRTELDERWGIRAELVGPDNRRSRPPILVSLSSATEFATGAAAGRDGANRFLVVWQVDTDGDGRREIHGQYLGRSGRLLGEAFTVAASPRLDYTNPSIGMDERGSAIVVWSVMEPGTGETAVQAQWVAAAGELVGSPVDVSSASGAFPRNPKIGISRGGRALVAWVEGGLDGQPTQLMTVGLSTAAVSTGSKASTISGRGAPFLWLEGVVMDEAGATTLVFERLDPFGSRGRFAVRQSPDDSELGPEAQISAPVRDTAVPDIAQYDEEP